MSSPLPSSSEQAAPSGLRGGGTSQTSRRPAALLSDGLALDARTLPELLAYVARFSEQVAFSYAADQPAERRWRLADHRSLLLLAVVAARPSPGEAEHRASRLRPLAGATAPLTPLQLRTWQELMVYLRTQATMLHGWYLHHRQSNRQPEFSGALVRARQELAPALRQASAYEALLQANGMVTNEPQLPAKFVADLTEGLSAPASTPDYAGQYQRQELQLGEILDSMQDLFWELHKVRGGLAAVAEKALLQDLETNQDHRPEVGLLVAFLQLYRHAQQELNDIPARHLRYYYRDVLRTTPRPSVPDQTYLRFALAQGASSFLLPAGTVVDGGKDAAGQRILFATAADALLGTWRVEALATLFVARLKDSKSAPVTGVYASALAEPGPDGGADWPLFGEDPTPRPGTSRMAAATLGFAVAAPVLDLREGQRTIRLRMEATAASFAKFRPPGAKGQRASETALFGAFQAQATGPAGWQPLAVQAVEVDDASHTVTWTLRLERTAPAVVGYDPAQHGGQLATSLPVVRLQLNPRASLYGYSLFAPLVPVAIRLQVAVKHLANFEVSNQLGSLDPGAPFYPFGAQALPGAFLQVTVPELLRKNLTQATLALTWQNLPAGGFSAYYAGYDIVPTDQDFRVATSYLADYRWQGAQRPTQHLFQSAGPGQPIRPLTLLHLPAPGRLSPAAGGAGGMLRIELTAPAMGFGVTAYPAALARVVQYNARHPTQPQPLPQPPFVPLLRHLSVSYEASETIVPGQPLRADVPTRFFHLHPLAEFVPSTATPTLLPQLPAEGSLFVGLSPSAAGQPMSLTFALTVPPDADSPPPEPQWDYLHQGTWVPIAPDQATDEDDLSGFANTLRLLTTLPDDLSTTHTEMPDGLCWLRARVAAPGGTTAWGRVRAVYPQLVRAVRVGDGPTPPAPYRAPLPPLSLTRLLQPVAAIVGVSQPEPSFGGRLAEDEVAYYTRVSEQLRHRGRALTPWDYEHLLLAQFPDVHSAKCLTPDQLPGPRILGQVVMVVLPRPDLVPGNAQPLFGAGELKTMQRYLEQLAPPAAQLRVRNPLYEQVQVRGKVAYRQPTAGPAVRYEQQLLRDLAAFLSPWQPDETGRSGFLHRPTAPAVAAFLNQLPYVRGISGFSVLKSAVLDRKHRFYDSATDPLQPAEEIGASLPWTVLVPAAQHRFGSATTVKTEPATRTGIGSLRIESDFIVACDF